MSIRQLLKAILKLILKPIWSYDPVHFSNM